MECSKAGTKTRNGEIEIGNEEMETEMVVIVLTIAQVYYQVGKPSEHTAY